MIKTKCMFTGTRQKVSVLPSVPDICIDCHKIERVISYKFLGVHVEESLSWDTNISEISKKVAKALGALRRLKPICPHQILVSNYKSLILPNFDYCSAVWGCIGPGLTRKLQKLQNRAARIITGSSYDIRSAQILSDLDWPNLAQRRANHLEKLMFKTMNNEVLEYISEKFVLRNLNHNHNLRGSKHNIFIPRPNTEALKKAFSYRGAISWNGLSAEAKQATSFAQFNSLNSL